MIAFDCSYSDSLGEQVELLVYRAGRPHNSIKLF